MRADTLVDIVARLNVELSEVRLVSDLQSRIILRKLVLLNGCLREILRLLAIFIPASQLSIQLVQSLLLLLHHELLGLLFRTDDSIEDIRRLFCALLIAQNFPLIDSKEQLDIQAVNILQQILCHGVAGLAKGHQSQEGVLAFELGPVCISITA